MAENSTNSTQQGRKPTSRTKSLTPDQALEILQEAVIRCQQSGIKAGVREYHSAGSHGVEIVLLDVVLANGGLVLANAGKQGGK